jgi:hypothetical protein
VGSFKNLLKNHKARKAQIYTKASLFSSDSSLYKSWSPGVGWGHNGENHFYKCLYWKKIFKFFSRTSRQISIKLDTNHPCIKGIQVCINKRPGPLQRGNNCKIRGGGHLIFFSQEPLGQKSSYLHKSFLI